MVVNSEQDLGIGEDDKRQCWFRPGRLSFTNISGDFVATKPQWRIAAARD